MQAYISKGKELIKILINNGYEAYFVGESVRNTILGLNIGRVDIVTSASIDDIKRLYNTPSLANSIFEMQNYTIRIDYFDYSFFFKSFATNSDVGSIDNRSTLQKNRSNTLAEELASKNFTINAIAMSYSGKVTDAYGGYDDITSHVIRTIANPKARFTSYPQDILEALELRSELGFRISRKTFSQMKKKSKLLYNLNSDDIIKSINVIISGKYAKKAIKDLVKAKIHKNLPLLSKGLARLATNYHKMDINQFLLLCYSLNGSVDTRYDSVINDFERFKMTYAVAMTNRLAKYDKLTLFANGLDVCLDANFINYCLGKDKLRTKQIKKDFEKLSIKKPCDLVYKGDEILRITNIIDANIVSDIMEDVSLQVLEGTLANDFQSIQEYVLGVLNSKGVYYDLSKELSSRNFGIRNDDEVITKVINSDYSNRIGTYNNIEEEEELVEEDETSSKIKELEERLDEQERQLKEKNERLKELEKQHILETTSKMVNNTIDQIKKDPQIGSMIKDINDFELAYRGFIVDYLETDKENEED